MFPEIPKNLLENVKGPFFSTVAGLGINFFKRGI